MRKEEILNPEKLNEKEPEEVARYELDPEKGIDVVIKTAPDVKLAKALRDLQYESVQIILQEKGKDILDFKEFLPKDYKFTVLSQERESRERELIGHAQDIWEHDEIDKLVILPRKWDDKSKDILGLLHEISHSWDKTALEKTEKAHYWYDIIDKIETLKIKEFQGISLKKARKEYLKLYSEMERYAWAKALDIVRKIRREKGIDLLKPFHGETTKETRENLEEYIHGIYALGAKEEWSVIRRPFNKEFKGMFTTKYYKGEKFTTEHRKKIRGKE